MKVGIVGAEAAKFTRSGEVMAKRIIAQIVADADLVVSGGCHLGGIDIWAEEAAKERGVPLVVHKPARLTWSGGYKERNLKIAEDCEILYNIVVARLPDAFKGMTHRLCYHCGTANHVKSGGCWTMKEAAKMKRGTVITVVQNEEER